MHIRLAALIIVIATLLLSFNSPSKSAVNYSGLAASCLGNKGGMSHVVSSCNTLMKAEGITPKQRGKLLNARGWAYYCGRQYDKAISDYSGALALQPDDATSVLRRAMALDALGDSQAAQADYLKRLQLDPDGRNSLFYKAKFDLGQGNYSAAILGFEKVLDIDPGDSDAGSRLFIAHFGKDGVDGGDRFLRQAKMQWPDEPWVFDAQVRFDLKYTGDHESAMEAVTHLARLKPGIEYEGLIPALVHLKIGEEDEGIKYVRQYAARHLEHDLANMGLFNRWYRKSANWLVLGQDEEWLYRYLAYATLGRPDIAKTEIDSFLHKSGKNGRALVLKLIQEAGIPVTKEAVAGSVPHLDDAITQYLDHLAKTSGFRKYDPPEKG
ncbi:tetratricopeptide repeat protein [Ruegeria halocynthiae]|uniref:tetratricopeptide repeat protein n=1 Tax=Ruegeria halocynthiae TaxID=985054 RepID=UPI00055E3E3F|nr:tetratricopeptide repeat protein [Ruegeria halocynthiae]